MMKGLKKYRKWGLVLMITVLVAALPGCGASGDQSGDKDKAAADNSLQKVLENGELRVGLCPEYPPFESINENNAIVGFDPDLANAIAESMGVKVTLINTPWDGLIAGLNNDNYDVVISAMSPEEATAATEAVQLSDDYYSRGDILVVKNDNTDIKSKEDLAGKRVGYQTGSSAEQSADKLGEMGIELAAGNPYNRTADAYAELKNGRIDAVIVSIAYAVTEASQDPDFKIVNDPIQEVGLTIVAKDGSAELIDKINEILAEMKDDGTYDSIVDKWLGVN